MLLSTQYAAAFGLFATLISALPLDTYPREIVPRQKSYAVINVDGGSTNAAQATTVVEATKTVEVVNPGPTIIQEITKTVEASPAATSSSSISRSTSSAAPSVTSSSSTSVSKPIETPKPIFVTVTVPKDDGPTEYYDNGLWHTNYRVKSFGPAVTTIAVSGSTTPSSTPSPTSIPTSA